MVDPLIEAASNNRWQAEAGEPLDDRPGLVASLLRYRWILVTATLLGAVAGYGISQRASVRYQANAVLILADPGGPSVLGGATSLGSTDRQVYLARQADIMTTSDVLERALELLGSRQSALDVRRQLDLVGRFFAERLSARTGYIVPATPDLIARAGFYPIHAVAPGVQVQGALRLTDVAQREGQLLNCAFFLLSRDSSFTAEAVRSLATLVKARRRRPLPAELRGHVGNILTGLGDLGATARARLRRADPAGSVLALRAQAEQAPNPDSRVTLGTRRDRFGLPVAQLDWRPTAADRVSIWASQRAVDAALRAAGLGHVEFMLGDEEPPLLLEGNFHHLGATRMHTDPAMGVVDADCRVHGVSNLYVAGSSVFPTYGCSNPTLTLVALALRLADHPKKRLAA